MAERNRGLKRIVVLMVPVGGEPYKAEIEDHYRAWQEAVGDRSFEMVGVGPGISIVCADDYHGIEDQQNGCGLYGPYFFVKVDANGHSRSLTEAQLTKCRRYWEARRHDAPPKPSELDGSFQVFAFDLGSPEHDAYLKARQKEAEEKRRFWGSL